MFQMTGDMHLFISGVLYLGLEERDGIWMKEGVGRPFNTVGKVRPYGNGSGTQLDFWFLLISPNEKS